MTFSRLSLLAGGLFAASLASAQLYNFDTIVTGDNPTGGPVYASMLIEDAGLDTVKFTLTPTGAADPDQFLSRLFLNLDPSVSGVSYSETTNFITGFSETVNGESFGGGNYDLKISFDLAPPADRLYTGRSAEWTISGAGLSADKFSLTADSGLYNVLQIQGIPGGGSSHVTASPVPEPGLFIAVGSLLLGGRLLKKRSSA
jgi:hypothetical protein